jgi:hypothetical protein
VGKLDAITKRSAGSEDGIPKAHRANMHGQINGDSGSHFARKNTMNTLIRAMISILDLKRESG